MVEILVALLLAFIVIWGVLAAAGERGGWGIWPVFLLLFGIIWAGGLWLTPVGPPVVGIYWLPFVMVAVFIGLFWAAMPPPPRRTGMGRTAASAWERDTSATAAGLGMLFWILLVGLAMAALVRYVWHT